MQRSISIALLIFIIAPIFLRSAVLIHYFIQRDFIAQELCEEKNVPDSCCKGSCVLKKELNKTESAHDDEKIPFRELKELIYCLFQNEDSTSSLSLINHSFSAFYIKPESEYTPNPVSPPPCR